MQGYLVGKLWRKPLYLSNLRLPERKLVTLVAAFRCTDGALFCADSQETMNGFRVNVHKLVPFSAGNFEVAIAGSGNDGDLVDSFVQRLEDELNSSSSTTTLEEFRVFAQAKLLDFLKTEASAYPPTSRRMQFLICARTCKGPPAFEIWRTAASRLIRVSLSSLIGWDHNVYKYETERMYSSRLPISQTIFVALRLFSLAKNTSNFVGGPTTVVIARQNGFRVEDAKWVEHLEDRVSVLDAQFQDLMFLCPDTSVPKERLVEKFRELEASVMHIRQEYLDRRTEPEQAH